MIVIRFGHLRCLWDADIRSACFRAYGPGDHWCGAITLVNSLVSVQHNHHCCHVLLCILAVSHTCSKGYSHLGYHLGAAGRGSEPNVLPHYLSTARIAAT